MNPMLMLQYPYSRAPGAAAPPTSSYDKPWRANMAGKAGAAGPGGAKGGKDGAKEAPARKQYQGPDQELAAMLERDIIDTAIKVTCVGLGLGLAGTGAGAGLAGDDRM